MSRPSYVALGFVVNIGAVAYFFFALEGFAFL